MRRHLYIEGSNTVRLHAIAQGTEGPVMLFLHGFPELSIAWHAQLAEFGRDHQAFALDLRGYGQSDRPADRASYALPQLVADVQHVLRTISPHAPAVLVGHDWGGIIGWALARESPELLRRLIIINAPHPALFARELRRSLRQPFATSYAAFFQLRGVAECALRAFKCAGLRHQVYGTSAKPERFSPELRAAYLEAWREPGALTAALNYYRNLRELKQVIQSTAQATVTVPTLVLWGERDPALMASNLVGLEDRVRDLTVQRHPTATHWIIHEEPEWVNATMRGWLESDA